MKLKAVAGLAALCICMAGLTGCGAGTGQEPAGSGMGDNNMESAGRGAAETGQGETGAADREPAGSGTEENSQGKVTAADLMAEYRQTPAQSVADKYRTFYEVFVYSFYDGNGDGIGDLPGLTQKLDYLNDGNPKGGDALGCDGLWLMPVMPSPSYHKYDITDYKAIDPEYGSMEEFDAFMEECGKRGISVILDLVMNHTSSEHEWFVQACDYLRGLGDGEPDAGECPYVEYYNFSREKKSGVYYPLEGTDWYYEGVFWSGMPDLNLKNERVRAEFEDIVKFWLDKGVAGFRLDAAKEYESGNNTANVEILSWFNSMVKGYKPDAYLVAEVWTDIGTYRQYYASGIDSVFNFAFSQQDGVIAQALNHVNGAGGLSYGQAVTNLPGRFGAYNPDYIDAPFYTNHDVARSAGYYSGDGSTEKTKLAQAMNLMMTGSAFLYYGEELGMKGSGKDENKRAPMYWTEDPDGKGMCRGPEGMDSAKKKFPSLEEQAADGNSVFCFVREAIRLRNSYPAIARADGVCLEEKSDADICVLKKEYGGQELLMVWNLGETPGQVHLEDLELNGGSAGESSLGGVLLTGTEQVKWDGGQLVLPPYSMAILR